MRQSNVVRRSCAVNGEKISFRVSLLPFSLWTRSRREAEEEEEEQKRWPAQTLLGTGPLGWSGFFPESQLATRPLA